MGENGVIDFDILKTISCIKFVCFFRWYPISLDQLFTRGGKDNIKDNWTKNTNDKVFYNLQAIVVEED